MKQPELGKAILEMRKAKGLTQEELVERCNISVRTLQRIEAGEVTPRTFTVRTIFAALDADLNGLADRQQSGFFDRLKHFLLIGIEPEMPARYLELQLMIAWISGLIYFVLGFLEGAAEYFRIAEDRMIFSIPFYVSLKTTALIAYFFFQRGFVLIGHLYGNYLLKIVSFILIFGMTLVAGYDIASCFYPAVEREFILGAEALTFGGIGILYGVALIRLRKSLGEVPFFAGLFEILAACFFLTLVLAFIGHVALIPAELLEIVILFRAAEMVRASYSA
jgi:transcriptional regulator with XRE-family HTH domain